jgi:hypothetical protein
MTDGREASVLAARRELRTSPSSTVATVPSVRRRIGVIDEVAYGYALAPDSGSFHYASSTHP